MKILVLVLAGWSWLWPWHREKPPMPPPKVQLIEPKCIVNDDGYFFYTQNGNSWGVSSLSCMDAVRDWQHTVDKKVIAEHTL